jgi:hypothetical protein
MPITLENVGIAVRDYVRDLSKILVLFAEKPKKS